MPVDILAGSDALRRSLDAGLDAVDIAAGWDPALAAFAPIRRRHLLY